MSDVPATLATLQSQLDSLKRQALTPSPGPLGPEPGYTTTEFWGTVVVDILAAAAIVHPGFTPPPGLVQAFASAASGLATLGYGFARTWRKKGS